MKKFSKKTFSILLALIMILSSVSASFVVFATEEDETVETVVTSDVMSVEAYEVDETSEDEIECDVEEFVEGDETSVELSADDIIESMNLTNGVSDLDLGLIEDEVPEPVDNGEIIEIDTEPIEDGSDEFFEIPAYDDGNTETDFMVLSFKASQDKLTIDQGGNAKVTLTYLGFHSKALVKAIRSNDNISAKFTSFNKNKAELTIVANKVGTTQITVNLYDGSGKYLTNEKITVTVRKTNYISIQSSKTEVPAGKSVSVGFNLHGGSYYSSSISGAGCNYSIQKNNWTSFKNWGYGYRLDITGTNVGTSKITIYLKNKSGRTLDSKTITVNVSKNASVTPSKSKVTVDIGATSTISFSLKNAYGNPWYSISRSNSNCVTSWSGGKLHITGKTAGTTTVTIKVYDGRGNYLTSTSINVTINRNPKLTPSASTVNLIPAQKSKVNIKLTGYDSGVYAKYNSSNPSICGLSWSGSWSNNSISLTTYGYKQGSTKITIYLYSSSGQYLTQTSVTVKVTGTPSISSASSLNVNMGAQGTFAIKVNNIATNYKIACQKSGSCFTASWLKVGKTIYLLVKGTTDGSGSIYLSLKGEDGVVVASKTIPVKILWVENPQITVDHSTLSFAEDTSGKININCTGTRKQFTIKATYSRYTYEPKVDLKFKSTSKSSATLTASCSKPSIARVKLDMVEVSTGKVLATKTVTFDITANTSEFWNITYGVRNYSTTIPLSTFRYMFDYEGKSKPSTYAKTMYNEHRKAGGVCYGFACTSMLFRGGYVSPSSFGASSIRSITNLNKFVNKTLNISAKRFVEGMYIMQFSNWFGLKYDLNEMCRQVKNGNRVQIAIFGSGGGHALIGYKLDEARHRLYVVDCNSVTDSSRYIELTYSNGRYTGWKYSPLGWSDSNNNSIGYQLSSDIVNMWNHRANVYYDDSFNSWIEDIKNIFITNSSEFSICDVEGNVLATYSDGKLSSSNEEIYEMRTISYLEDPDFPQDESENPNIMISLPRAFYVIDNKDYDIDSFDAQMINYDYGVSVSTEADQVAFGVDDTCDLCTTSVSLEKGESYDITLLSSREGEEDIRVEGQATAENVELGFAMVEGQLTETNSDGATVNLNGVPDNYYKIEATATEGGSIYPEGTSNIIVGSDFIYSITPDEGYYTSEVLVDGEPVGAIEEYTFFSTDGDSTIEARFEKSDLTVTGVEVKKDGYNSISWQPAKASNGYEIYRKSADGEWEMIADVESDVLDYIDEDITSNFYEYSYSVKAYSILNDEKIYGYFDEVGAKLDSFDIKMTVSKMPNKTEYYENDVLDVTGLEIALTYSDNTTEIYNSGFNCDVTELNAVGEQDVNITFDCFTTSFKVIVNKLYFDVNWIVEGETSTETIKIGDEIIQPDAPIKEGYKFMGWTPAVPETMPEYDLAFTAVFEKSYTCPDCGDEILGEDEINAHIAIEARLKATVKIKNNSGSKTIYYGETLCLTATTTNMPADVKIYWYVDGEKRGEGETFNVNFKNGTKTVEVKLVDSNGNVLKDAGENEIKDSESVTVKGGFFQKIISFFKNLFGLNRTVVQTVFKGIF